jgi:hypothetical protein
MLTDIRPRNCAYSGAKYRPKVDDQRFCRRWCRMQGKAAEGRAARRVWWRAGRPMVEEEQAEQEREAS